MLETKKEIDHERAKTRKRNKINFVLSEFRVLVIKIFYKMQRNFQWPI